MIFLRIHKKGYYVQIPGLPPFRTPVEANITHINIPLVVSKLKEQGITDFEIISEIKDKRTVLTNKDFVKPQKKSQEDEFKDEISKQEKRIKKLEKMIEIMVENKNSDTSKNGEQITNTLERIEILLKTKNFREEIIPSEKKELNKPVDEAMFDEDDTFIPSIDLGGFEVKGKSSGKTVRQDKTDINDNVDLLSRLSQKDK